MRFRIKSKLRTYPQAVTHATLYCSMLSYIGATGNTVGQLGSAHRNSRSKTAWQSTFKAAWPS